MVLMKIRSECDDIHIIYQNEALDETNPMVMELKVIVKFEAERLMRRI
jgi:hypothetical protein